MKRALFLIGLLISLVSNFALADGVKVTASSKNLVRINEQFRIVFEVNAQPSDFQAPEFTPFQILSGPNASTNSSYTLINGKMSQSFSVSYSYIAMATKEGEFTIPAATVVVDGKKHKSNPIKIKVIKGNAPQSQNQNNSQARDNNTEQIDAFLKAKVSKTNPYLGEQVIVTYKLYYLTNISDYGIQTLPAYPGCWSQDLHGKQQNFAQYREEYNGKVYEVAEIRKEALIPQKTGIIESKPMEFQIVARIKQKRQGRRNDPFDDFFNDSFFGGYKNIKRLLASKPIKLNVQALPTTQQPEGFTGAVGDFSIKADIDNQSLKTNEAFNLKFAILGKGNIKLIDQPDIQFPPDFEVYDPKVSENIKKSKTGIAGVKTFEYTVIPRTAGDFNIAPISFSFFDPKRKQYRTVQSANFSIHVEKGAETTNPVSISSVNQEDIKYIGQDIRFIKNQPFKLLQSGYLLFGSTSYVLFLLLPLLLAIILYIAIGLQRKRRGDVARMKTHKATKVARNRLKKAKSYLANGQSDGFYEEISQALWGYLSDKFTIPRAELSTETINNRLQEKQVKQELIDQFINTLHNCEFARFAPGDKTGKMESNYNEALRVISATESELK